MIRLPLTELLDGWRYAREGVIDELDNIPAELWTFRPMPAMRSVAELAQHINDSGRMMSGELSHPDGDFTRLAFADFMREYGDTYADEADKAALIERLRRSHEEGETALREAGVDLLSKPIVQFNGTPATRASWMAQGIAHEDYHRGQIAVYARLLGLVPKLTQLIEGS
jgi:uncharacterized protein (TIGR02996 family)